jgi:hypothetical protein
VVRQKSRKTRSLTETIYGSKSIKVNFPFCDGADYIEYYLFGGFCFRKRKPDKLDGPEL